MKRLVIDSAALKNNIDAVKSRAEGAAIYAVVKGDGYGIGIIQAARRYRDEGITRFAVTEPGEAKQLRQNGFEQEEILMLRSTSDPDEIAALIELDVTLTIGSNETAVAVNGIAESMGTVVEAHIKIDTGMGRYGFLVQDIDKVISIYRYMTQIAVVGLYTHLHSGFGREKAVYEQYESFKRVLDRLHAEGLETGIVHISNSSALFKYEDLNCDAVRIGSAFLGRLPLRGNYGLVKVGYCEASLEEIKWIPAGHTVGYGAAFKAKKPTRVAIIPVGYYNGFSLEKGRDVFRPRDCILGMLSYFKAMITRRRLYVKIGDSKARVLGHVGMLHTCVDVTDIECSAGDIAVMEINPLLARGLEVYFNAC